MYKNILAIFLLAYAVFGNDLFINNDDPSPSPVPNPISILNIDKPNDEIINRVEIFSQLISDPTDRAKIALFNYEFANRIQKWETSSQQVNDVYTLAGEIFFQKTLVNKYDGLAEVIIDLMKEIMTEDNHTLSKDEKYKLNQYFTGVAWVLIQKD